MADVAYCQKKKKKKSGQQVQFDTSGKGLFDSKKEKQNKNDSVPNGFPLVPKKKIMQIN